MELSNVFFGPELVNSTLDTNDKEESALLASADNNATGIIPAGDGVWNKFPKTILWYFVGMPIWTKLASVGKESLTTYVTEMALKSPHPIRIGNVRFARAKVRGGNSYSRVVMLQNNSSSSSTTTTQEKIRNNSSSLINLKFFVFPHEERNRLSIDWCQ